MSFYLTFFTCYLWFLVDGPVGTAGWIGAGDVIHRPRTDCGNSVAGLLVLWIALGVTGLVMTTVCTVKLWRMWKAGGGRLKRLTDTSDPTANGPPAPAPLGGPAPAAGPMTPLQLKARLLAPGAGAAAAAAAGASPASPKVSGLGRSRRQRADAGLHRSMRCPAPVR
jgi:hypothetical protein